MLDSFWHNTFGLDETSWSTPHAMIGWGVLLTWWAFISTRLALGQHVPVSRPFAVIAGMLSLSLPVGIILGPLDNYQTDAVVKGVAAIPVLAATEAFQHTVRITLRYDLTYGNPLFVPLAACATGFGLAFLWGLFSATDDRPTSVPVRHIPLILRPMVAILCGFLAVARWLSRGKLGFLLVALLATLFAYIGAHGRAERFNLLDDARNFLPLPYIAAAVTFVIVRAIRHEDRLAWAVSGIVFGLLVASWWDHPGVMVLLAAPAMVLGAVLGARAMVALREPDLSTVRTFLAAAICIPLLTGVLDLFMRANTP